MSRRISKAPSDVEWPGEAESRHILWVGQGRPGAAGMEKEPGLGCTAVVQVPRLDSPGSGECRVDWRHQ